MYYSDIDPINQFSPALFLYLSLARTWSLPKYEYCRYRKILGNTGYISIADTGRFNQ
jgi:hypothetical protein